jgi:hypothetical protein
MFGNPAVADRTELLRPDGTFSEYNDQSRDNPAIEVAAVPIQNMCPVTMPS